MKEPVSTTLVVDKIVSQNGGGCIFNAITTDERILQVVVPYDMVSDSIKNGETYEVSGDEIWHKKYGPQILADKVILKTPNNKTITNFLIYSEYMRGFGLGKKKVLKLYEYHGDDLVNVLDRGDIEELNVGQSALLSKDVAQELINRWKEYSEITGVISYVVNLGLQHKAASLIQKRYRLSTIEIINDDPFRLVAFVGPSKKSWELVDGIAHKLGVDSEDPRRKIGAAEMAIYSIHDNGHTASSKKHLVSVIKTYHKDPDASLSEALNSGLLVVNENGDIQHHGIASLENWVGERLRSIADETIRDGQTAAFATPFTSADIDYAFKAHKESEGWDLNDEQKLAVHSALLNPFTVITGGAGVGKTSVLKVIGDAVIRADRQLFQIALAGRAAKRIQEATNNRSYTIAAFVAGCQSGRFDVAEGDFIIIDECSMVSLADIARILKVIPNSVHLIFVGDDYQLPPVSFGEVFSIAANDGAICKTKLTKIYRQDEATGIPFIARKVRDHVVPNFTEYSGVKDGVFSLPCSLKDIRDNVYDIHQKLSQSSDTQILSMTNTGIGGVSEINRHIQYRKSQGMPHTSDRLLFVGDPVLYLVNDYERELYNGSLGTIESIVDKDEGEKLVVLWDDGVHREIGAVRYRRDFNLAYSITVHKAQGSQFDRVIIPMRESRRLDNRMVYTALTRAVRQVVFVGSLDALKLAITADPRSYERMVGLSISKASERLRDAS